MKKFIGLDIGTTKICAIVAEITENGKINVLGMSRVDLREAVLKGMVFNIERTVEAIKIVVEDALRKSNVNIDKVQVHVGIAGQHIKSIHHRGQLIRSDIDTEICQDDIEKLITDVHKLSLQPGERILHVFPMDYIIDGERGIREPIGAAGIKLEGNFHIITCQINAARNIEKCINKAGLEMADMILEPVASADAVLSPQEKKAGVVLVDIGGGTTDVAIFEDGMLRHTAVIPLAGEIITKDIQKGCNVVYEVAEALKIKFGSAMAEEVKSNVVITFTALKDRPTREILQQNLAKIIQARVETIFEQVYWEIKSSGLEKKLQGGIILTGGGSQLSHLTQLVEFVTGIDAKVGYPNKYLTNGLIKEVESPAYATCIGLIINGLYQEKTETIKEPEIETRPVRINLLKKWLSKPFEPFRVFLEDGQNDFKE